MTTTKKIISRSLLGGFAFTLVLAIAGCVTSSTRDDLTYGKALMASGSVKEAYVVLQRAALAHPGDAETKAALESSRDRLANFLLNQGNTALAQGRFDDAEASYKQLGQLPGSEGNAQERLKAVSLARAGQPVPLAVEPGLLASSSAASSVAVVPAVAAQSSQSSSSASRAPLIVAAKQITPVAAPVAAPAKPDVSAVPKPVAQTRAAAKAVPPASPMDNTLAQKVTLQFRDAPVRSLFDAIGKSTGVNIVLDKDVQQDLRTSIYLKDTTVRAALEKIVLTTRLAWSVLDDNTLLIYPDEQPKQADYQNLIVRSFQLANADPKFVANSLKTVLKFKDVVVDEKLNMLVIRDTPEALRQAEQLIAMHDVQEPEVVLDVQVLEISQTLLRNLGIEWPSSVSLVPLPATGTYAADAPIPVRDLSASRTGVTGLNAVIRARKDDGDVRTLANPHIRTRSREKAKILVGQRVPNITATTSNGVVAGNVTYIDVGLKLDVEPQVLADDMVNIKIALEVSTINKTVTSGSTVAYEIGTRNASSVLRLKDGETQILGGLIQDEDRNSSAKIPLLGDIPILGRLFGSKTDAKNKSEIVLSITPRIVRGINRPQDGRDSFDAGTLSSVRGRRADADASSGSAPDQQPQVVSQPAQQGPGDNGQPRRRVED